MAKHLFDFFAKENQVKRRNIGSLSTGSRGSLEIEEAEENYKLNKTISLEDSEDRKISFSPTVRAFGMTAKDAEISSIEEGCHVEDRMNGSKKNDFFMISTKPVLSKLSPKV